MYFFRSTIAQCIQNELRQTDVVARHGGDEFIVLLSETGEPGAIEVSTRMKEAVAACRLDHGHNEVPLGISIGIATFPEDGHSLDSLLNRADRAMYMAKQNGRNGVVKFSA